MCDSYSRFLEVAILKSTTNTKIIETINRMFARFGVPFSLRTDNGLQFMSEGFESLQDDTTVASSKRRGCTPEPYIAQVSSDC